MTPDEMISLVVSYGASRANSAYAARDGDQHHSLQCAANAQETLGQVRAEVERQAAEVDRLRSALQIADGTTGRRTAERDHARAERDDALITIRALVDHPEPSGKEAGQ